MTDRTFAVESTQYLKDQNLAYRTVAGAIPCSETTLRRLSVQTTLPTPGMIARFLTLRAVGFEAFKKLSEAEKEKIAEAVAAAGGGAAGVGVVMAAISALGIPGLSGAGIVTGLVGLGGGTGMLAGIAVATVVPLAAAGLGYGVVRGVKYLLAERALNRTEIDPRWEVVI